MQVSGVGILNINDVSNIFLSYHDYHDSDQSWKQERMKQ